MTADGNGCQRIVHTEFAGHGYFHSKIHQTGHMEGHSQFSGLVHQLPVLGPQHAVLSHAEALQCTGMSLRHYLPVFIVTVNDSHLALFEQQTLAMQIFLKACMFIWTDMIRLQICKNAVIEYKSLGAVKHQCLGRYFHNYRIQSGIHHAGKILL